MRLARIPVAVALLALIAAPLEAQEESAAPAVGARARFSARAGATISPDQFHLGFHVNLGEIAPRLRFQPGAEIGFGSSRTTIVGNVDALYLIHAARTVQVLAGGGLGFGMQWTEGADSRGLFGGNLVGAVEWGTRPVPHVSQARGSQVRYVLELRAGLGDLPSFKVTVGLQF